MFNENNRNDNSNFENICHILTDQAMQKNIMIYLMFSGLQDPPGQDPVQPTVGDPASAGGLD